MTEVERLLLGGPRHGQRVTVDPGDRYLNVPAFRPPIFARADGPLDSGSDMVTYTLHRVPGTDERVFIAPDFTYDTPEWLAFDTEAWVSSMVPGYVGWERRGQWRWRGRPAQDATYTRGGWLYVLLDERAEGHVRQLVPEYLVDDAAYPVDEVVFGDMQHEIDDHRLPLCVVPACTEKGRTVVTATEGGRLAGRRWRKGDEIRLCPHHYGDVLRSAGAYGVDELPEWLRADARLPDDTWSLEAALHWGADSQLRTLRVAIPMREEP